MEQLPGQSGRCPNQETVQDPTPTIKLEQQDEKIDVVGVEVSHNRTSLNEVKEVLVTQDNTVDLYVSPVAQEGDIPRTQSSQLDTNSDKDPQEPIMTVTHSLNIKDEIDLTCLADGTAPPPVHQYLKLKAIPLKDSKKKVKKISMKKMKTIVNLTNEQEYDYGLSSIPPSTSDHPTKDN